MKKKIPDQYTSLASKPTHLYTIFTEMVAHYCHFSSENSPSPYQHRNNGSLLYLEQFQNHPIGIPKMAKMHLKTFEHPRKSFFREYPPGPTTFAYNKVKILIWIQKRCAISRLAGALLSRNWFEDVREDVTSRQMTQRHNYVLITVHSSFLPNVIRRVLYHFLRNREEVMKNLGVGGHRFLYEK